MSDNRYDAVIAQAASRYGVDFNLVKALVKTESNFNPDADSGYSVGLMQVTPATAGLSRTQLLDPAVNVMAGTKHLLQCLNRGKGVSNALSEYNGGYRPSLGYGAPYTGAKAIRVCNAWKPGAPATGRVLDRDCIPGNIVTVYPGELANQKYVDTVLRWYGVYAQEGASPVSSPATSPVGTPTSAAPRGVVDAKLIAVVLGLLGTLFGLGRRRAT